MLIQSSTCPNHAAADCVGYGRWNDMFGTSDFLSVELARLALLSAAR